MPCFRRGAAYPAHLVSADAEHPVIGAGPVGRTVIAHNHTARTAVPFVCGQLCKLIAIPATLKYPALTAAVLTILTPVRPVLRYADRTSSLFARYVIQSAFRALMIHRVTSHSFYFLVLPCGQHSAAQSNGFFLPIAAQSINRSASIGPT